MKKIVKILITLFVLLNLGITNADLKDLNNLKNKEIKKNFNVEETFIYFSKFFEESTPESYNYIYLKYSGIEKGSEIEKALKILVYNNKIPNLEVNFGKTLKYDLKILNFYKMAEKILGVGFSETTIKAFGEKNVDLDDLKIIKESYEIIKNKDLLEKKLELDYINKPILERVFNIIMNEHYDKEKLNKDDLYYSAIKGITNATGDKHTTFFPPTESKDFLDGLSGDFEGIGTYVDMPKPGIFQITTPIVGGPAEKAGIKGGDIVISVDGKEITEKNSQNEIISWIKGKAGTQVDLKIKRGTNILNIKVIREKVHLKSIETEFNGNNFIIKINGFNENVSNEFKEAIEELNSKNNIRKIVIDLRNNGGGYLNEVIDILSFLIEKGKNLASVKYSGEEGNYISRGFNLIDVNKYEIVFIQNSGTASASEIMIGTMKDYYPEIKVIGEKSYGKGSVQTIKEFEDGSSLKYTTAKWFTGKTKTGIDGVGIEPDIKIDFDENKFKNYGIDNQLEKALSI